MADHGPQPVPGRLQHPGGSDQRVSGRGGERSAGSAAREPGAAAPASLPTPLAAPLRPAVDRPSAQRLHGGDRTLLSGLVGPTQRFIAARAQADHSLILVAAVCSVPGTHETLSLLIPEAPQKE